MNPSIPGGTNVLSKLQVLNNPDRPVVDMQHIEGGRWSVPTLAERDAIPALLRLKNVTECYVESEGATYVLRAGILNANWIEVKLPATNTGTDVLRLKNYDEGDLLFQLGAPLNQIRLIDSYYFHIPQGRHIVARYVRGLPDGLGIDEHNNVVGSLTQTIPSNGLIIYSVKDSAGDAAQVICGYSVVGPGSNVRTWGDALIDVLFGAMSADEQTVVFDYDLALQVNQPGFALHGARCFPSGASNTRFIGTNTVAEAIAIAAMGKGVPEGGGRNRFYRFGVSLAAIRSQYPNQATLRFDLLGKTRAGNTDDNGANNPRFYLNAHVSAGLQGAVAPIGFIPKNVDAQPRTAEFTNNGQGYAVTDAETLLAYLVVNLNTGATDLTVVAPGAGSGNPNPATPQFILIDGPLAGNTN